MSQTAPHAPPELTLGQLYSLIEAQLESLPKSRAQALALTHLHESVLWAQIAYSGTENPLKFIQALEAAQVLKRNT